MTESDHRSDNDTGTDTAPTPAPAPRRGPAEYGDFPLKTYLGMELSGDDIGSGHAVIDIGPQHANPNGVVHGAVLFALVDTAMGKATMSVIDEPGVYCASIEVSLRFIRPAVSGRLHTTARVVALRLHPHYRGKVQMMPKCPVRGLDDFAIWYTPGVAAASRAIAADPEAVWSHTNRANTIAIVSDGSRVLGLGDIGPEAGLPVMEGKALLFKYLGGVDAVPICVDTSSADELVAVVEALQPSFGGINLEDISQPTCFEVLDRLRDSLSIPVWHDDQQGTATVVVAALRNALEIVQKSIDEVRIALVGVGAANMAVYRLLPSAGVDPGRIVACDRGGILHPGRSDIELQQDRSPTSGRCAGEQRRPATGDVADALRGADVCLAFSSPGPDTIEPEWVSAMADDAVVFACANPTPEIWPWDATEAGARVVSPPDAPTSRTRSTTRSASPASSAACSTYAPAASPTRWRWPRPTCSPATRDAAVSSTVCSRRWPNGRSSRTSPLRQRSKRNGRDLPVTA
jgi:uncharacterized protein (TIGR00369 family)